MVLSCGYVLERRVKNLLKGIENCARVWTLAKSSAVWKLNGKSFRLECKKNNTGRFLLCSITDEEARDTSCLS